MSSAWVCADDRGEVKGVPFALLTLAEKDLVHFGSL